jgi:glycosyltransferase involved in cell wall biosynthesis
MKIEIVSFTGDSGLADYAVSLARALAEVTHTTVVTAQSLPARFSSMGFSVVKVFRRSRHYPLDIVRFFAGVLRRRPDWVLLQGPLKFAFFDALVVRTLGFFGIGMAVTVHDVLPHYPRAWSKAEYGFYYRSFKRVVVHSDAALEGVRALGVKCDVLTVPHGAYDIFNLTGVGQKDARQYIGQIAETDFVVLFFGHLEPRKGLMPFLDAAEAMQATSYFKFVLAGSSSLGSHAPEYAARLEAARSMPNVLVHDKRIAFEDVENYFSACDVVALPYLEGTTSGVLKLAFAFGKPVVATRVGDLPEQVPAGAGLFIESNSAIVPALCDALATIKANQVAFSNVMAAYGQDAQWPDIAARVVAHLQSK